MSTLRPFALAALLLATASPLAAADPPLAPAPAADAGALVEVTARSTVGVLLDELPRGMRRRVAQALRARPESFWKERAAAQLRLTSYRLIFREFFYGGGRRQLPLPPEAVWSIELAGEPRRRRVDGHDVVAVDYRFRAVLVTDAASPGTSEPRLAAVGGVWREPFVFPVDPELLLQRTGYACMDEDSFPFSSVDSEEADSFYDQDCTGERELGNEGQCHYTRAVRESCLEALVAHVGAVSTQVRYERVAWDAEVAAANRYGRVSGAEPDLEVYLPDFLPSRVVHRYVHASGCEVAERCVSGTGWRRLLQFATSDENVGERPLTIGGVDYFVDGHGGELDEHNLFEYSACHDHYHFGYYGELRWDGDDLVNSKQGFCLQSTARTANRETSPLHNAFGGCDYQGVEAGWVDQYKAGLPCQWVDVTDFAPGPGERSFNSNPRGFLCEGTFVDEHGAPLAPGEEVVWAPTGLTAANGEPVEAPLCELRDDWDANNEHRVADEIPPLGEGLVTTDCTRGQLGPKRNCGFALATRAVSCTPGAPTTATFSIPRGAAPQVVRLCDYSHALGAPIPCRHEDTWVPLAPGVSDQPYTLADAVVTAERPVTLSFACPSPRTGGEAEPGGVYSVYTAPVFPDDDAVVVTRQPR